MNAAVHRRPTRRWLLDIEDAIQALRSHLERGDPTEDRLVYDAVRFRTMTIGEAVKQLPLELLDSEPAIPWRELRQTRDRFAHRYFMDDAAYLRSTVVHELDALEAAVRRMLGRVVSGDTPDTPTAGGV